MTQPLTPAVLEKVLSSWEKPPMYQGLSHEDLNRWLCNVRLGCKMRRIPRQQWADVAIYFMNGDLKVVMAGLKSHMEKSGSPTWEWEAFQKELTKICGEAHKNTASAGGSERGRFLADHPFLATTAGVALVGSGCIVVAPAIALGALNLVGFGASGPIAGSIATTIQSAVYGGATTGLFSLCQSFAATTVAASPTALTGAVAAISSGTWFIRKTAENTGTDDNQ